MNFASQDYLSLASHPQVKEAAVRAIEEYGVHSAGSAALLGNTKHSLELERVISEFLHGRQIVLYPTGWSAGFAAVQGFVRPDDHVVMDVLAHSCLQEGARAATQNIHYHGHLNVHALERRLQKIRATDTVNGILVVTESLFSMHSDTPDIRALRAACDEYKATLLVDCAHDLGCIGDDGLGHLGLQNMLDEVDIIVGSFSKTFAANGGFVAVKTRAAAEYLKYYSATQTFSNALSPVQAASVLAAFEIVRSAEGSERRQRLMNNILYLRAETKRVGLETLGDPSAIVPVRVGAEGLARIASRNLAALGAIANLVEYPAVPQGRRPLPRAGDGRPQDRGDRRPRQGHAGGDARRPTSSSAPTARRPSPRRPPPRATPMRRRGRRKAAALARGGAAAPDRREPTGKP